MSANYASLPKDDVAPSFSASSMTVGDVEAPRNPTTGEISLQDIEMVTVASGGNPSPTISLPLPISISQTHTDFASGPESPSSPHAGGRERRRSIQRRYSNADLTSSEAFNLADSIFAVWDTENKGFITPSELQLKSLDKSFYEAMGRVLGYQQDGRIYRESLAECISVLKNGDMSSKVKLLVQFMDSDSNGTLSLEEIQEYLKVADDKMMKRLGLSVNGSGQQKQVLRHEDILALFQDSDRGEEAITIFCEQILRILTALVPNHHQGPRSERLARVPSLMHSAATTCATCKYPNWMKALDQISHAQQFMIALGALQIFLWLFYFFHHKNQGYPLAFCFAKGFGLNLRILTLLVYATMARTTMGSLYAFKTVRPFIPLGINIEVHAFLGFSIFMHAFGHTFGHIAYKEMHTDKGFSTAFTQNSLLRGDNWENKLKGDGKTGFILLGIIIIMGCTALFRSFSSKYYRLFALSHFLYLLYLPMIFLHIPNLWPYFVAITALMVLERSLDLFQNTLYTTLSASRPCANGITFLSIPRYGMQTYPGSYYRIRIPALSYEWHPFSLAGSTSSHHLVFFIASAGDWTRELHKLVSDPIKRQMCLVQVQGPFLAPASQALIRKPKAKILCVASGIGITPFFSLMATKVTDEVNYENDRIMYSELFSEAALGFSSKQAAEQKNSLLQVLQTQWKVAAANNNGGTGSNGNSVSVSKENSSSNLFASVVAIRRNTNSHTNLDALVQAVRRNTGTNLLLSESANTITVNNSNNNGSSSNILAGRQLSGTKDIITAGRQLSGAKDALSASPSRQRLYEAAAIQSSTIPGDDDTDVMIIKQRSPTPEAAPSATAVSAPSTAVFAAAAGDDESKAAAVTGVDMDDDDDDDSVLKVVWSIRELTELSFYLDYVHHIVKSQEVLAHHGSSEDDERKDTDVESGDTKKRRAKHRVVVEVEVYLTGLGSKTDPVYMLSQTMFLLSIAHKSTAYMKIHFGRPDLSKIVQDFRPEEVYYCGGNALKTKLNEVCHTERVPFHPEDFDAGGGDFVRGVSKYGTWILESVGIWKKPVPVKRRERRPSLQTSNPPPLNSPV